MFTLLSNQWCCGGVGCHGTWVCVEAMSWHVHQLSQRFYQDGRRTMNSGLVLFFPNPRGFPIFLSVQDKLSELLLLLALGACLVHKLFAHLKFEIVVTIKSQGISYRNLDFWLLFGKKNKALEDIGLHLLDRTGW